MPDITIPEPLVQIVAERILHGENSGHMPTTIARAALRAAAPHIAAQALKDMGKWFDRAAQLGTGERDVIAAQACYDRANQIEADHG